MRCRCFILVLVITFAFVFAGRAHALATERCGSYTVVLVPGVLPQGGGRLTLVDRGGRRAHQIRSPIVSVERCEDVTGDDRPDLIVSTNSGGQRCCTTFHVLELGVPVRTLLQWGAGYQSDLDPTDLADATPAKELAARDDRLSGFGGLPAAVSPTLPAIFCYERGAFIDCTRRIREPLLLELTDVKETLKTETNPARRRAAGVNVVALSLLLDEEPAAWTWLAELAGDTVPWLQERRAALTACIKTSALAPRDKRLAPCAAGEQQ